MKEVTTSRTFVAAAAMAACLRVALNASGQVALAGAEEIDIGTTEQRALSALDSVSVALNNAEGTRYMTASAAITALAQVYGAASGKISATPNGNPIGYALEAASGDGSVIEVFPTKAAATMVHSEYNASSVDKTFGLALRQMRVIGATLRVTAAGTDGSAVSATLRKVASGTAIGSGQNLLSASFDLKGTANTNQAGSLTATSADLLLASGDSLAIDFTGTLTSATGVVSVLWVPANS